MLSFTQETKLSQKQSLHDVTCHDNSGESTESAPEADGTVVCGISTWWFTEIRPTWGKILNSVKCASLNYVTGAI